MNLRIPGFSCLMLVYCISTLGLAEPETHKNEPAPGEPSLLEQSERVWRDPLERRNIAARRVQRDFRPYLEELHLDTARLGRIETILIDGWITMVGRIDDLRDKGASSNSNEAEVHARTINETLLALGSLLEPGQLEVLRRGLETDFELSVVRENFARLCAEKHLSLSGSQMIALAYSQHQHFSPARNAQAKHRFTLPLDGEGLTILEEGVIQDMSGILSTEQLALLRGGYQEIQRKVRKT